MPVSRFVPSRRTVLRTGLVTVGVAVLGGVGYDFWASSTYSHGWRMGTLHKLSARSTWRRGYMVSTGEGELMLGVGSSRIEFVGADGQTVTNPWLFTTTLEQVEQYAPPGQPAASLLGKQVAVEYRQIMDRYHAWRGDTDYRVERIVVCDPSLGDPNGVMLSNRGGGRSIGTRLGRVVKVTRKGTVAKSWEVLVQENNSGNSFIEMSILNDVIYRAALDYLMSGRLLLISYDESVVRNPIKRDTNYEIVGLRVST